MIESKENIRHLLLQTGRELVEGKGAEYLTARKLSEASGCSVGTIYNQFSNMDKFIETLNLETLDELISHMKRLLPESSAYTNLNTYLDSFVNFVLNNSNRWFLLYNFHLKTKSLPASYKARIIQLMKIWEPSFDAVYVHLSLQKRRLSRQVLWLSLFAMSSFLTTHIIDDMSLVNKKNLCKLLLNTYLAGLAVLKKG